MPLVFVLALLAACDSSRTPPTASKGAASAPGAPGATAKTADDCMLFLVKARATLTTMSKAAGVTYSASIEERALADCRTDLAAGTRSHLINCVLTARDEAGVQACFPRYEDLVPQAGSAAGMGAARAVAPAAGAEAAGSAASSSALH